MQKVRNRLLITLVLVAVVAATTWAVSAAEPLGILDSGGSGSPAVTPASGEPDVGQTVKPPCSSKALAPTSRESSGIRGLHGLDLFRWASKIWAARYLRSGI